MNHRHPRRLTVMGVIAVLALALGSGATLAQEKLTAPDPGVPEIYTIQGQYVRVAYNNEGYVSLGYRVANQSVGEEWMLLEMGATVLGSGKSFTLKRDAIALDPDGKTIPLASNMDYRGANLQALEMRAKVVRDSINYFPPPGCLSDRLLCRPQQPRHGLRPGGSELAAGLRGPALFQRAGRHPVRAALPERPVREQPGEGPVPNPDQGGGEDVLQELAGRQEGSRRGLRGGPEGIQPEQEVSADDKRRVHETFWRGEGPEPDPHPAGS